MSPFLPPKNIKLGVIGLGYVGLPLAVALGSAFDTLGFDTNSNRVTALQTGSDATGEVEVDEFKNAEFLRFSADEDDLASCDVFIVAVPTPIDNSQRPDLKPLISASEAVGRAISKGGVVIYESTVYPGATEEDCIPIVEKISGLKFNVDFFAGYSPERINPGDKTRPLRKIVKVTSGSTPEVADFVDSIYSRIIDAGTFKASSIRVAEASKIIENTQRDVNIALINELSIIFSHLNIDTNEVLDAAATKWNFIPLRPGLVGGHCIGVDPYYLVHKSSSVGFIPDIIRTAREINDGMARNAVGRLVKAMVTRNLPVKGSKVLVVGCTFKENCPDIRNTKVVDLLAELRGWGVDPVVVDTWASSDEVLAEYGFELGTSLPQSTGFDAIILAVPHEDVVARGPGHLRALLKPGGVLFDMKAAFALDASELRL
ncbi:nucleotide sugar dehydrogenase [Sulfitobacter sp. R18_2]|uniref:nucleotide sugar dehydrogenase n=1 Tax=Sulfitobacter sp. R18_2 TaxID=2821105 RepID=UPI001AD9A69B|nr:nucleotide sugar dehydrogenase [Sulfitobacter sp. R18_2]MBO9440126.1 nucleotide sugar dehydrogenase [Sulfitobacter sp. R18_2]